MADPEKPKSDVKIHEPDRTLHAKTGNANLGVVLNQRVVRDAENVIAQVSDKFWDESIRRAEEIQQLAVKLKNGVEPADKVLPAMVDAAFSIKTKAGQGGYDLVSALAKSLQIRCEKSIGIKPSSKNLNIIDWHIDSIRNLLTRQIKGDGGPAGVAIMAEVERLAADVQF